METIVYFSRDEGHGTLASCYCCSRDKVCHFWGTHVFQNCTCHCSNPVCSPQVFGPSLLSLSTRPSWSRRPTPSTRGTSSARGCPAPQSRRTGRAATSRTSCTPLPPPASQTMYGTKKRERSHQAAPPGLPQLLLLPSIPTILFLVLQPPLHLRPWVPVWPLSGAVQTVGGGGVGGGRERSIKKSEQATTSECGNG